MIWLISKGFGIIGYALVLVLLTGGATRADGYALDTGDALRVSVFGEASYPQEVVLDDRGVITLPLLGEVRARGLTTASLARVIQRAFREEKLILEPFVKVEVKQYRPFFISGAVARPGSYPFQPGITVRHALAIAGGFRPGAAGDAVSALQIADLRSERANLRIEEYRLKVRLARLAAERQQMESFPAPPDPPAELGVSLIKDVMASEKAQLDARLVAHRDEISFLESSLDRLRKEAEMVAITREERERTAKLQLEELESMRGLRDKGLVTNSKVMDVEKMHNRYRADLAQAELQETRAQQEILNLESQIRRKQQSYESTLIAEVQDTQVRVAKLESQLKYVTDKLLFVSYYGGHRSFDDLHGSVNISIFRRNEGREEVMAANELTSVRAGDVIEVSIAAKNEFYAPDQPGSAPDELPFSGELKVPPAMPQPRSLGWGPAERRDFRLGLAKQ